MISYRVELTADDNGTLLVTCPDLPGVVTFGETEAEALHWASDAIEEWIASCLHGFDPVPRPTPGEPRATLSLHTSMVLELYWALRARGWTRADLQRALGWHRPQVDRLFDLRQETKISRLEAAFRAIGVELDVQAARAA
jgi:antitoxin HicB